MSGLIRRKHRATHLTSSSGDKSVKPVKSSSTSLWLYNATRYKRIIQFVLINRVILKREAIDKRIPTSQFDEVNG